MSPSDSEENGGSDANRWFASTHWSVVLAAGASESPQRSLALEALCRAYWQPLYSFIRRLGHEVHDAQDLTQEFLTRLLARNPFGGLGPDLGKFRSFLLVALKNFLADERAKAHAAKRGGGLTLLPLDLEAAESAYGEDATASESAEMVFDRRWAVTVMDRAFLRLQEEFSAAGKAAQFGDIQAFLSSEGTGAQYEEVGSQRGMTAGAVAVAVHRLRQRYGALVREEVAHTVASPMQLEEEMRYLVELLGR